MLKLAGIHCQVIAEVTLEIRPDFAKCDIGFTWSGVEQELPPTASSKEIIAKSIRDTPDIIRILEKPITIEILNDWCPCKDNSVRISKCFLSGKGQPDDPLLREKEEGTIDEFSYEHIWLETALYETIWRLINTKGKKILKILKLNWEDTSFNSGIEIMQQLIREDFDESFFAKVHAKFYQYNSKLDKELQILNSQTDLSDEDNKRRERLISRLHPHAKHALWSQKNLAQRARNEILEYKCSDCSRQRTSYKMGIHMD